MKNPCRGDDKAERSVPRNLLLRHWHPVRPRLARRVEPALLDQDRVRVTGEVGDRHRGDVEARGCERREARFDIIRPSCAFPCDPFPCL